MTDTPQLGLPLVQPAQSQKHVTVNEALTRLDALTALTLESRSLAAPPANAPEGAVWAVPQGATGPWQGQDGALALRSNGGWAFLSPRIGWRGWIGDEAAAATWDGQSWLTGLVATSQHGASTRFETLEIDVPVTSGSIVFVPNFVPNGVLACAVTGVTAEAITGTLSHWTLGRFGNTDSIFSSVGVAVGASAVHIPSPVILSASLQNLLVSAVGGTFAGGKVRIAVHVMRFTAPSP